MTYLLLFWEFFKTGLFAVGGGLATLPFLQKMAQTYPWFDSEMLSKMIAVSESTPGPIGINMATYAGYHTLGIPGALVATFALVLPSVIVIMIVATMLQKFRSNPFVESAFYGLRPAVVGMIASAAVSVLQVALLLTTGAGFFASINYLALAIFCVFLFCMMKFKTHPLVYIAAAAVLGIVFQL